jgi:hypothetical protein
MEFEWIQQCRWYVWLNSEYYVVKGKSNCFAWFSEKLSFIKIIFKPSDFLLQKIQSLEIL